MIFSHGNQVTLLRNGTEFFPALERAIDEAKYEIQLETYIYEADVMGERIRDALARAAKRGVICCVLMDGFGSRSLPRDFIHETQAMGVRMLYFRPELSSLALKRERLRRLHRKLAIVDGRIAFVGGINIIDDMNAPGHTPPRIDYAVRAQGPIVGAMHASATRMWRRATWAALQQVSLAKLQPDITPVGHMRAAFVKRDNALNRRAIEGAYLDAIHRARNEIIIANAYFLPGRRFRHALLAAARRGVRVVLLLQARVEYLLFDYAARALYGQLLGGGIEIYEYHTSFMHSKVAVIDSHWATVGSSNIDPFSLWLSNEANIVVDDEGFARELREDLQRSLDNSSRRVHRSDWKKTPLTRRISAWLAYGCVRFLLGVAGYSKMR
ncbi:MAG: cardiolipin synthase ClsB [Methylobacillus sp.]|jgi:cardiolipin synthase|nr:cardiolipin synthase ClsB [Methylobacillus sp.]